MFQVQSNTTLFLATRSLRDAERIARDLIADGTQGAVTILWVP